MAATVVYNEFIHDRQHVHMNSTKWLTLTDFVKHLGKTGQCKVEDSPKGWFISYIDREPETIMREVSEQATKVFWESRVRLFQMLGRYTLSACRDPVLSTYLARGWIIMVL